MPTPTRCFLDVAARYGNVDPGDPEAVQHWFLETLPTLPHATINEIFEELLSCNDSVADDDTEPVYPIDAPLPSLSESPAAPIPVLAIRLGEALIRLMRRSKK